MQALILSKYQWTPTQILEMDDRWLDDILLYAYCESIVQRQEASSTE